jgi:hypothetical protein
MKTTLSLGARTGGGWVGGYWSSGPGRSFYWYAGQSKGPRRGRLQEGTVFVNQRFVLDAFWVRRRSPTAPHPDSATNDVLGPFDNMAARENWLPWAGVGVASGPSEPLRTPKIDPKLGLGLTRATFRPKTSPKHPMSMILLLFRVHEDGRSFEDSPCQGSGPPFPGSGGRNLGALLPT